jgi:hypothetical protein
MKKICFALLSIVFFGNQLFAITSISIIAPTSLMDTSISRLAILDVQKLLTEACNCEVTLNQPNAEILLKLPNLSSTDECPPNRFQQQTNVPYYPYPDHDYKWTLISNPNQTILELEANCWQGVSFGLYGLLQEQLGFRFYHPRETIIPKLNSFPIQQPFEMEGVARFDKKGFHLHTMHPLELTEQLHDGTLPNALEDIKQYLDWLVRNGQTYFDFCLLESIDRKVWIEHAKAMVAYGKSRGLIMAVDLSLHMIQQKTFQLYKTPPESLRGKKKQIDKNLTWLMQANWDMLNMEFDTAEFIGGNQAKKELLRLYILDWMKQYGHTKLMGRKHVVKEENESMAKGHLVMDSAQSALDKERGVLIHTVMYYSMTDTLAPVYENENLTHMFDLMLKENEARETWYYPESAYWITFDNSIPMMLLPYLNARLADIDTCVAYNIPGHITFTSGWEWGYWLFDWSIARWSWQYTLNGVPKVAHPTNAIEMLMGSGKISELMEEHLNWQQEMLKDSNLIQWLTAMTVTDEMPFGLSQNFQPRPPHFYEDISNTITLEQVEQLELRFLPQLKAFGEQTLALCEEMSNQTTNEQHSKILREWIEALHVTGYRSLHRHFTLQYLLERRKAEIAHQAFDGTSIMESATKIRLKAQAIVQQRESQYRYPVSSIARRKESHTAYPYGYLYPVSNLHFWQREEQQALQNKWNFRFMNMWEVLKIIGLKP